MTLRRGALTLNITVDDSVTQNACNIGKARKPNIDMCGICTERFRLTAGEFYPELAEVGKGKCGESRGNAHACFACTHHHISSRRM